MINRILLWICLPAFILWSCTGKFNSETVLFNQYLDQEFDEAIPSGKHMYLLVCQFGCQGCIQESLLDIAARINTESPGEITILTYKLTLIPPGLISGAKVLLDEKSRYENIGLPVANVTIIKTLEGGIKDIRVLNLDSMDKIIGEEFCSVSS